MWLDISIIPEPDARSRALRRFIKHIIGVADMRFLDSQGAGKVINAIKAIQQRESTTVYKKKRTDGPHSVNRL